MQRPRSKQSPQADAKAKAQIGWIKERGICIACGNDGGVIAHHCVGSTFKVHVGLERVQIGNEFAIGLCQPCDNIVTRGSHRVFRGAFGSYAALWAKQYEDCPVKFDDLIIEGIANSGR